MKIRDIHIIQLANIGVYWKNDYLYVPFEAGYKKIQCSWLEFINLMSDNRLLEDLLKRPTQIVTRVPKGAQITSINDQNVIVLYKVNSSNIDLIGYDQANQELYIKFLNSNIFYQYHNVTPDIWDGFKAADSKGSFTHWWIKVNEDTYPFDKLSTLNYIIRPTDFNPGSEHPNGYLAFSKQPVGILFLNKD